MSNSKIIKNSAAKITTLAMLTALSVVIGIICKSLFTVAVYYRFTLENIGVIFAGIFFGPVSGILVGAAVDVISCLLSPNPAVNPIILAGAVTVGAVSGLVPKLFIKKRGNAQFFVSGISAHLLGQVIIKSIGKMIYFGMPWYGIFIGLLCSILAWAVEFMLIRTLYKNREIGGLIKKLTGEKTTF